MRIATAEPQSVRRVLRNRQNAKEETVAMDLIELAENGAALVNGLDLLGSRRKDPERDPVLSWMRSENAERIAVPAGDDRLDRCHINLGRCFARGFYFQRAWQGYASSCWLERSSSAPRMGIASQPGRFAAS